LLSELKTNKMAYQKQNKQLLNSEKLVSQVETKLKSSETQFKSLSQELKRIREKHTEEISKTSHLAAQLRQLEKV